MKKLKKKLLTLLYMDMGSESESNDLSILIRLLSITSIIHYLLIAVSVAYVGKIYASLTMIFCIGILLAALITTYENKTMLGMVLYIVVTIIIATYFSFSIGWKYNFITMVMITTMLVFFSLKISMDFKILYSIFSAILIFVIGAIQNLMPIRTAIPRYMDHVLLLMNTSLSIFSLSIVAYSFCAKFTRSEEKILQYNKKLEQMVSTDALTTLWNRRAMNEHLSILTSEYIKHKRDFSLAIMDIDWFKRVNDEHGHGMGDYVLKSLSYLLKTFMDGKGHVARWGGEEFLLTFENMDFEQATKEMENLRKKISQQDFNFKDVKLHLTITGGIEEYNSNYSLDSVITHADEKLYLGKTTGRNKIVSFK